MFWKRSGNLKTNKSSLPLKLSKKTAAQQVAWFRVFFFVVVFVPEGGRLFGPHVRETALPSCNGNLPTGASRVPHPPPKLLARPPKGDVVMFEASKGS